MSLRQTLRLLAVSGLVGLGFAFGWWVNADARRDRLQANIMRSNCLQAVLLQDAKIARLDSTLRAVRHDLHWAELHLVDSYEQRWAFLLPPPPRRMWVIRDGEAVTTGVRR